MALAMRRKSPRYHSFSPPRRRTYKGAPKGGPPLTLTQSYVRVYQIGALPYPSGANSEAIP